MGSPGTVDHSCGEEGQHILGRCGLRNALPSSAAFAVVCGVLGGGVGWSGGGGGDTRAEGGSWGGRRLGEAMTLSWEPGDQE